MKRLWVGVTGVPFGQIHEGRKINPNWMVEDARGRRRTRHGGFGTEHQFDTGKVRVWPVDEIAVYFGFSV